MNKKILFTIFALTFVVSVFCLCTGLPSFAECASGGGSCRRCEFADGVRCAASCGYKAVCAWDVEAEVYYGSDVVNYKLSDNLRGEHSDNVYLGAESKTKLLTELRQMQLPFDAVCNYILPRFNEVVDHFGYVDCDKVDAEVRFDGDFRYDEGNDGLSVDKWRLLADVVKSSGTASRIQLPVIVDKAVTVAELKQNTVLKGKFTTNYYSSGANRSFNIQKCVKTLNGTIVDAGEKFSFNEVVGPRTEECGYKNAVIISNGSYVEGVGGGVCQVSTTLYNALLLANFLPKAHRHTLVSSYVRPGFDAMVSYGTTDLSFVNDTDMPVYIAASAKNRQITFCVYGVPDRYRVERQSDVEREPFDTEFVTDKSLNEGQQKVITHGSDGVKSKSYLLYYDGDVLVRRVLLRSDVYKKVNKVVAVPPENTQQNAVVESAVG